MEDGDGEAGDDKVVAYEAIGRKMKKLDIYIIKKFLGTFFFSLVLILSIVVVFDLSERLEKFLENDAPLRAIVFDYYLNYIPYFANMFSALFTFISVIFFTSKMAYNSEIIAILSTGISFRRLVRPYMISAGVIAVLSLLLSAFIIPNASKTRVEFSEKYIWKKYQNQDKNIHQQIAPGEYIYMSSFSVGSQIGYDFSYEVFDKDTLKSKLNARLIEWNKQEKKWSIKDWTLREFDGEKAPPGALHGGRNVLQFYWKRRIETAPSANFPMATAPFAYQPMATAPWALVPMATAPSADQIPMASPPMASPSESATPPTANRRAAAIPPLLPPATIDLPGFTPDLLGDAALKEGCKAVLSFAARHRIPADFCHIREGQPDEVIPTLCAELNPTALFIGTSARKGLAVALVGNICERVVDELDCDVAVITPKAVIERVPMAAESVTGLH